MARYKKNAWGSIILDDGSTITKSEQRKYILEVKKQNAKRQYLLDKYYEQAKNTPNMKGISKEAYGQLLEEKGFIGEKLTTSFKGLTEKDQFKQELRDLRTVNKKGYHENKVEVLRKRMLTTINHSLGASGQDVFNIIANMLKEELVSMYVHSPRDLIAEIFASDGSVDDQEERAEKTRSTISILTRNITTKDQRETRVKELKDNYVKRPRIIRNRGKREKIKKKG